MNEEYKALFTKILRENGYRITTPRQTVFALLIGHEPQSMHTLITRAKGTVDRVSIYRIIELFEKLGVVNRITIGWKYKLELSDIFLDHHHHLSCLKCGKIVAIKDHRTIEETITKLSNQHGFILKSHQLEVQGVCPSCRNT
jgi:Fur family transcriptional regulator, ferric uptake regulator